MQKYMLTFQLSKDNITFYLTLDDVQSKKTYLGVFKVHLNMLAPYNSNCLFFPAFVMYPLPSK